MRISQTLPLLLSFAIALSAEMPTARVAPRPGPRLDHGTALDWLQAGNDRHVAGRYVHWHQSVDRRRQIADSQRPHAVVLSCSDSQVPPEIVFDQGLGDLYVVRNAGAVLGERELGSIEHAVSTLGVSLIVVLGHQRCAAAHSALEGRSADGHFAAVMASLSPAVVRARDLPGDKVDNTVRANSRIVAETLRSADPVLADLVRSGKVRVVEGYYSLDTGAVYWTADPAPVRVSRTALPH